MQLTVASIQLPHSLKRNVSSLPQVYGKCSDEFDSLISSVQIFTADTHLAAATRLNNTHFTLYSFGMKEVPVRKVLPENLYFVEQTTERMFPETFQF